MAEANFNLVLHPEARFAAADLERRLGIPWIELRRFYEPERIHRQYQALSAALGVPLEDGAYLQKAEDAQAVFQAKHPRLTFAVGECANADPFALALSLARLGYGVSELYATVTEENFPLLARLAALSPETRLYSNLEPTMLYYDCAEAPADVTIGRDAGYYQPDVPNLPWNAEAQPFGYAGVSQLFAALDALLDGREAAE